LEIELLFADFFKRFFIVLIVDAEVILIFGTIRFIFNLFYQHLQTTHTVLQIFLNFINVLESFKCLQTLQMYFFGIFQMFRNYTSFWNLINVLKYHFLKVLFMHCHLILMSGKKQKKYNLIVVIQIQNFDGITDYIS
jgi:hypothetical protein